MLGSVTPFALAMLLLMSVALVGAVVAWMRSNRVFAGYQNMVGDARKIALALKGQIFRDDADLVISGNYHRLPTIVRFSRGENTPGLNIRMEAATGFTLSVVPRGTTAGEGRAIVRSGDEGFDKRFSIRTDHPLQAKLFLGGKHTFAALQKVCHSGASLVSVSSGGMELSQLAFPALPVSTRVMTYLAGMAQLGEGFKAMPGGGKVTEIRPMEAGSSRLTRAAMALGTVVALSALFAASRELDFDVPLPTFMQTGVPVGMPPADATRINNLKDWEVAEEADFERDAAAWLRSSGVSVAGRIELDLSGIGRSADVAYVLKDDKGSRRLVVLAAGETRYDAGFPFIGLAARIPSDRLDTIRWAAKPPMEAEGDGLLIVRSAQDRASGLVLFTQGRRIVSGVPADYQTITMAE